MDRTLTPTNAVSRALTEEADGGGAGPPHATRSEQSPSTMRTEWGVNVAGTTISLRLDETGGGMFRRMKRSWAHGLLLKVEPGGTRRWVQQIATRAANCSGGIDGPSCSADRGFCGRSPVRERLQETHPHHGELETTKAGNRQHAGRDARRRLDAHAGREAQHAEQRYHDRQHDFREREIPGEKHRHACEVQPDQNHDEQPPSENRQRAVRSPATPRPHDGECDDYWHDLDDVTNEGSAFEPYDQQRGGEATEAEHHCPLSVPHLSVPLCVRWQAGPGRHWLSRSRSALRVHSVAWLPGAPVARPEQGTLTHVVRKAAAVRRTDVEQGADAELPPPRDTLDSFDTAMPIPAGQPAPNLSVSTWVQGAATNLDQQRGNVVLIEVFQVNCPGCFFTAIPEAIKVHDHFDGQPVTVLGIATAFEDWDKNTLDNLQRLAESGEVIGETRRMLDRAGMLDDGKLRYRIPFPLAMDELDPVTGGPTREQALAAIRPQVSGFDTLPEAHKSQLIDRVTTYLKSREYAPTTFDRYALQGTPSTIIVDKRGTLRGITFGQTGDLAPTIQALLDE